MEVFSSPSRRLDLLPLHRLASGLRKFNSLFRPEKNTFIHYDSQVEEEDDPADIKKCISNVLDGTPSDWKHDLVMSDHVGRIVASHRLSAEAAAGRANASRSPSRARAAARSSVSLTWPPPCEPCEPKAEARKAETPETDGRVATHGDAPRHTESEASPGDATRDADSEVSPGEETELPSIGSAAHEAGTCKPCAWHSKPGGCGKGTSCSHCHLCDDGAVKRNKKAREARLKERRRKFERASVQ